MTVPDAPPAKICCVSIRMDKYYLQTVIVDKNVGITEALKQFHKISQSTKKGYRETEDSYRFKNIDKNKFDPTTYRSKKISDTISLVFGKLKNISKE